MKKIHVSDALELPAELAARTQAILAMKGMGKTYLAMKETEEMLKLKQQVVCFDPTGVWYGLRSSADGKSEGFPILIFGGDNADVPLEPTAGEYLADFVQDSGRSAIFDMSHFESLAAQDRFVTDFAIRLYRAKAPKEKRNTIHLMLDEADSFAPQKPAKNQLKMLGAWEAIVRRGRSRGLGLTMITQRPAVINKNVLSQVDLLICLRIVGIHDFKAVKEWTDLYATKDQKAKFMSSLPSLELGEAWFWSPGWLRIFQRATISPKITFDSSRTPEPGEKAHAPKKTAAVDLGELTEQIKATVKQAEANDPQKLRGELNKVRQELLAKNVELGRALEKRNTEIKKVEVPVFKGVELDQLENAMGNFFTAGQNLNDCVKRFETAIIEAKKIASAGRMADERRVSSPRAVAGSSPAPRAILDSPDVKRRYQELNDGEFKPNGAQQRVLNALAWYDSIGNPSPTPLQVGAIALIAFPSGHFNNTIGPLVTNALIYRESGTIRLTQKGKTFADLPDSVASLREYHDVLRNRIRKVRSAGGKTVEMLDAIIEHNGFGTQSLTTEALAQKVGIAYPSGHFNNMIGPLSTLGLIRRREGRIEPTSIIFPPGLS